MSISAIGNHWLVPRGVSGTETGTRDGNRHASSIGDDADRRRLIDGLEQTVVRRGRELLCCAMMGNAATQRHRFGHWPSGWAFVFASTGRPLTDDEWQADGPRIVSLEGQEVQKVDPALIAGS